MIYYVSANGNNSSDGSINAPFKTINHAAQIAVAGDIVKVFGGTYREWVNPVNSGTEDNRIIFEAVDGEKPIIKGSEIIDNWENVKETIWKKVLPNDMFGEFNPYNEFVEGDWFEEPLKDYRVHLGDVYINGTSMFEAKSMDDLYDNTPNYNNFPSYAQGSYQLWDKTNDKIVLKPELTTYKWYATVDETNTTIFCNFQNFNPNEELVEINVRPCCFYPISTGINYITLRGFEFAQAACQWAPPSANQICMVGPHWSKGWIIENNILHDAKCCAISLGKDETTGDNLSIKYGVKSNHRHQLEAVFSALQMGWDKNTVGSHIVRNNEIYDCGQAGIVGHMGCIFSVIEHNHIYNISLKHEFWGHEMAGIKFHAAIDVVIKNNNIHNCSTFGIWLDWQTQGTRLTANVIYSNLYDFVVEVSHGPYLLDHNLFLSQYTINNISQGGAFVHNLFCGKIKDLKDLTRSTPYHFPHSTAVAGCCEIYGGDDRYLNNLFIDPHKNSDTVDPFTKNCDKYTSYEKFEETINSNQPKVSLDTFVDNPSPVMVEGNGYSGKATPSANEKSAIILDNAAASISSKDGIWTLNLEVPENLCTFKCEAATTKRLGKARLPQQNFEESNGNEIDFSKDLIGENHTDNIIPGPFASLKGGKQQIIVWKE